MILEDRRRKKEELGKWLTNVYDGDHARVYHSSSAIRDQKESNKAWFAYVDYLEKHLIGPPKSVSKEYTVEQLEKMHMVGLYAHLE